MALGWEELALIIAAFVCEFVDSTLGMGYGTTLTPLFLLMGYEPLQIVPAVLLSELVSGLLAAAMHHRAGNVSWQVDTREAALLWGRLRGWGYVQGVARTVSLDLRVGLLLAGSGVLGAVAAVLVAVALPKAWLKLYIGVLVLGLGVALLVFLNRRLRFSWRRLSLVGLVAAFNKALSGGGYGPLVTGGQMLAGVEGKNAVGITSFAEGLTCAVGLALYVGLARTPVDWRLAPYLLIGATLSTPLSALSVRRINVRALKVAVAVLTTALGAVTTVQALRSL